MPPYRTLALLAWALISSLAAGQTVDVDTPVEARRFRIGGTREQLFVAASGSDKTLVLLRSRFDSLAPGPMLAGRIDRLLGLPAWAIVFLEDGSLWMLQDSAWRRGPDLPARVSPYVLAGHEPSGVVFALVESRAAATLPTYDPALPEEQWQAFTPRSSTGVTLVRFEAQRWSAVAECPPIVVARPGQTALLATDAGVMLLWIMEENQVASYFMDAHDGQRRPGQMFSRSVPGLRKLWCTNVEGLPTIVLLTEEDGEQRVLAERWVNAAAWPEKPLLREASLQFSAPPEQAQDLTDVCGFNDHLCLLWTGPGTAHLQFARTGGPALEPTVDLREVVRNIETGDARLKVVQWLLVLFMVGVLAAMFLLRPSGLLRELTLPAEMRPALTLQRVAATATDLLPFAIIWALVIQVNIQEALQVLMNWQSSRQTPATEAILWWAATAGSYTLYALAMELGVRSTAGKALLGLRVVSDKGRKASAMQIVIRNLLRFIELAPPFWILMLLVVLSPNRQRLGDLFARTLVVRLRPPAAETAGGTKREGSQGDDAQQADARAESTEPPPEQPPS